MKLNLFGIELRSLESTDLEKVRKWRNLPHVRENMDFQEEISPEQQSKWFESLSPRTDFYFIASREQEEFGVLHLKAVNWDNRTAEAGIFVGETSYLGTDYPIRSILALNSMAFSVLYLRKLWAKVKLSASENVKMNTSLGYQPMKRECAPGFTWMELSQEGFEDNTGKLRNYLWKNNPTGTLGANSKEISLLKDKVGKLPEIPVMVNLIF